MKELNEAAKKAEALYGINDSMPISDKWAKWYHYGIPDFPEDGREIARQFAATQWHCLDCTSMSGCFFIDEANTFPKYPHHPNCHCKKLMESPQSVIAFSNIDKFISYAFINPQKAKWMNDLGFTMGDSGYLKSEFERQAKEKYISGDYTLGELNRHGQRINIRIEVFNNSNEKKYFIAGWMVRPNGLLTLNTPFGDK